MNDEISYETRRAITVDQFVDLLRRSTLGERRPVENAEVMRGMLTHATLLCSAWAGDQLVGVARSVTDYVYCCYLSDLAVDQAYQRHGIGRRLVELTQQQLKPTAKLILLSAPKAVEYYPKLGFDAHPSAWTLPAHRPLAPRASLARS